MLSFYYVIGLLVAMIYLRDVFMNKAQVADYRAFRDIDKDNITTEQKALMRRIGLPGLIALSWTLLGLITSQWIIFLVIFLIGFLISPISSALRSTKVYPVIIWFTGILRGSLCLFLIINHFHIHFDVYNWLF